MGLMMQPNRIWGSILGAIVGSLIGSLVVGSLMGSIGLTSLAQPTPTPAKSTTSRASLGQTLAELDHIPNPEPGRDTYRLRISRQSKSLLDTGLDASKISGFYRLSDLQVLDLDGDREPEVLIHNYSGGAHCCSSALVYRYTNKGYQLDRHEFGNGGYGLRDSDKDGKPEFWSRDDAFAYAFVAYAGSRYPLQIWQYDRGNWQDVTRRYPKDLKDHAFGLWSSVQEQRQKIGPKPEQIDLAAIRGTLAAYLADKYLLNQGEDGWQRVRQAYTWPDRESFFKTLQRFLQVHAYIPGTFNDRISFGPNEDSGSIGGRLLPGVRHRYRINMGAGQSFSMSPSPVTVRVIYPDGKLWYSIGPNQSIGIRKLPQSGDYGIELTSDRDRTYGIQVQVR
jgi:hypothetical protein